MSGSRRKKVVLAASTLVAAALLMAALLVAGPGPGVPGAARGPWAVTREALARLWNGALEVFGLRSEPAEAGTEPSSSDEDDTEPAAGTPPAEPKRGGATDPDG
jgi:hypothetical protein